MNCTVYCNLVPKYFFLYIFKRTDTKIDTHKNDQVNVWIVYSLRLLEKELLTLAAVYVYLIYYDVAIHVYRSTDQLELTHAPIASLVLYGGFQILFCSIKQI